MITKKVLMKGNEAIAEAAIQAGCRGFFGYPITPQTEIPAYMAKRMPQVGGIFVQAESEIAAVNMVYGAASTGARVMTSSSSPGISLKTEGISYLAGADLPALIVNVQRGGPGLGSILPAQSDYWQATRAPGHGDLHILVFAPASVQEMIELVEKAYLLAEKYRMPAMLLIDGILGQMMEPAFLPQSKATDVSAKAWAATGHRFARKHTIVNSGYLLPQHMEQAVRKRFDRYRAIESNEPLYEEYLTDDAEMIVVAYGATARISKAAVDLARKKGIQAGLIRPVTLWPFPTERLAIAAAKVRSFLVVEMSMGQMIDDIRLAVGSDCFVRFLGRTGGVVPTRDEILEEIIKNAGGI